MRFDPGSRKIPAPEANPETRPFWEAATAGRLLIGKCKSCGKPQYYPRAICPLCGSDATEWVPASGRGAVYSYSVMRRVPVPYALAYVTLEEGVTMMMSGSKSSISCTWRSVKPPPTGITVQPRCSAP